MKRADLVVGEHYAISRSQEWVRYGDVRRAVLLDSRGWRESRAARPGSQETVTLPGGRQFVVETAAVDGTERWSNRPVGMLMAYVQMNGKPYPASDSKSEPFVASAVQIKAPWKEAREAIEQARQDAQESRQREEEGKRRVRHAALRRQERLEQALGRAPRRILSDYATTVEVDLTDVDALLDLLLHDNETEEN